MTNMLTTNCNIAMQVCRQQSTFDFQHALATEYPVDMCTVSSQTKEAGTIFPLYTIDSNGLKISNLNLDIVSKIKKFADVSDLDIYDYVYATLYSPTYRSKFKDFLKIDFPRIPYPNDNEKLVKLLTLGARLRKLHLLDPKTIGDLITSYPVTGTDKVDSAPTFEEGKVYINKSQYFGGVTESVWDFYIGGYQPAQKWLKDRKGRVLDDNDLMHYQKLIVALSETIKIMKQIGEVWGE